MTTQIPSFNNRDKLSNIRNKSLNPAIQKVNALELNQVTFEGQLNSLNNHINTIQEVVNKDTATLSRVVSDLQQAEMDIKNTFTYAAVDGYNKLIEFAHKHPGSASESTFELDLSSMFAGITEAGIIVSNEHEQLRGVKNAIEFTGAVIESVPNNPRKAKVTVAAKAAIEGGIWLPGQGPGGQPHLAMQQVKGVTVKGNLGDTNWKDGRLEIDLPHLSVRDDITQPIKDVEAIRFAGANVTRDKNVRNGIVVDTSSTISVQKGDAQSNPLTKVIVPDDSLSEVKNASGGASQELTISQLRASIKDVAEDKAIDTIHIESKGMAYLSGKDGKTNELHIKGSSIKVQNDEEGSDSYEGTTLEFAGATVTRKDSDTVKIHGLRGFEVQYNEATKGDADILNFEEEFQYSKPATGTANANRITIKPMTIKDSATQSEHNVRGFKVEDYQDAYLDKDKFLDLTGIVRDGFSAQQLALNISHDGDVIPEFSNRKLTLDFNPSKYQPSIVKALVNNTNGVLPSTGSQILKSTSQIEFSGVVSNSGTVPNSVTAHFAKNAIVNEIVSKVDSAGSNVSATLKETAGSQRLLLNAEIPVTIENGSDSDKDKPFNDVHIALPGSTIIGKQLTIRGLTAEDADGNDIEFSTDDEGNPHNVVGCLKAGTGITFTAASEPADKKAGIMTISAAGGSGTIKGKIAGNTSQYDISKIVVENGEWMDDNATLKINSIPGTVGGNTQMIKSIEVNKGTTSSIGTNGKLTIGTGGSGSGSSGITIAGKGVDGSSSITQDNTKRISYGDMFSIAPSGSEPNKEVAIAFNKGKLAEVLYSSDSGSTILKAGTGIDLSIASGKITITNTGEGGSTPPAADNKIQVTGIDHLGYDSTTGAYNKSDVAQQTPKIAFGSSFDTEVVTEEGTSSIKIELANLLSSEHYSILTTPPVAEYTQSEAAGRKKMPYTMLLQDPRANLKMDQLGHFSVRVDGIYDVTVCAQVIGDKSLFSNLATATIQLFKAGSGSGSDTALGNPVAIKIHDTSKPGVLPTAALHTFSQELVSNEYYFVEVSFGDLTFGEGVKAYTPSHMNYVVIEPKISETHTGFKLAADNRALMSGLFLNPGFAVATLNSSDNAKAKVMKYSTEISRKTESFEE